MCPLLFLENQRGSAVMANSLQLNSLVRVPLRVQFCLHIFGSGTLHDCSRACSQEGKLRPTPVASVCGGSTVQKSKNYKIRQ